MRHGPEIKLTPNEIPCAGVSNEPKSFFDDESIILLRFKKRVRQNFPDDLTLMSRFVQQETLPYFRWPIRFYYFHTEFPPEFRNLNSDII